MKKIYIFIIMILLFPMFVYAEDNNLVLKSITLEKLSEDVEELSPATIENNKINLDLKMYEVGDTAEYIVTIENSTDKDLYLEQNIINTESTYFDYELLGVDKSTVIENNNSISIDSSITIKKVKPNPCTFDGELVQGAEYTNGQYTYRYMQELILQILQDILQ